MMETASTSETSANFYQTTRRYNPEDSHFHTHRHENLRYYQASRYCLLSIKDVKAQVCSNLEGTDFPDAFFAVLPI
jgi:hypothetical protein